MKLIAETTLKREEMITEFLKHDFSRDVAKEKIYHYRCKSIVPTFLRNLLFLYLFLFLPYLIQRYGFESIFIKYITGLIPILLSISFLQHKIHKYFFPDDANERFASSIKAFLYPPYSIRVSDLTAHNLFAEYHPIVPASIILKRRNFEQFCKEILVDLFYPNYSYLLTGELIEADAWHRNLIIKLLNEYLEEEGISTQALLKPPKRFDNTCKSFCPRCGNQYGAAIESCSDCSDIKLISFTSGS
jgi:hypothetical protein